MKTYIYYIDSTNSYIQGIDCINDAKTARKYIEECEMNTNGYWDKNDIGATIKADIYKNGQEPIFDEPIETTYSEIRESDLKWKNATAIYQSHTFLTTRTR